MNNESKDPVIWIEPDLDDMMSSFFFHGKESGPEGTKTKMLKQIDPCLACPDFRKKNLEERLEIAEQATDAYSNLILVGSSMGGLVASLLYQQHPERFAGLLLLAPAWHWEEAKAVETLPTNTVVVHGTRDDIVPYDVSKQWLKKFDFKLVSVNDDHRLHNTLGIIKTEFKTLWNSC